MLTLQSQNHLSSIAELNHLMTKVGSASTITSQFKITLGREAKLAANNQGKQTGMEHKSTV
jgi:hypothetical protein